MRERERGGGGRVNVKERGAEARFRENERQ